MIIDFTQKVLNVLTGEALQDENKKELSLLNIACNALFANIQDENAPGEEKLKRWELASRIIKNPKTDLTVEEVSKLKEMIGKAYSTIAVGAAFEMLDPKVLDTKEPATA